MSYLTVIQERWTTIIESVRDDFDLSAVSFRTWFLPMKVKDLKENEHKVIISVPLEDEALSFIKKKYTTFLQVKIEECTGFRVDDIDYITEKEEDEKNNEPVVILEHTDSYKETNLLEKYNFDSFVVGSNNDMAHAASLAVAEQPGGMYNPLFIYGGVGLGKTHLMQAIGNFILKNDPSKKVLYISSERFTVDFIDSLRTQTTHVLREKYRNVDVLLIDDIQFFIGKEKVIEELFHTFNELHSSNKAIVISSDRPPQDFRNSNFEDRLVSRFGMGLTVDIQSPDFETRVAILRKKEDISGYHIDNEVINFIAMNVKSNIRELEGALNKVVAGANLLGRDINLDFTKDILKDLIDNNHGNLLTPSILLSIVAEHYNVTPEEIMSTRRNKEIVLPRQITMYLCREYLNMKQETIGKFLDKDHTTIMHGIRKINKEIVTDEELRSAIEVIKKKLSSYSN